MTYGTCFLIVLASNAFQWRILWGVDSLYLDPDAASLSNPGASVNVFMAFDSDLWVLAVLGCSVIVSVAVVVGFQTRLATILLTILCWSLTARNPLISDGGDNLMVIALFLLSFTNSGEFLSVDNVLRRRRKALPRNRALIAARLKPYSTITGNVAWMALAAQVCILYSTSGLAKVQGHLWQDGTAVYYILRAAEFSTWPALSEFVYENGYVTSAASYMAVLVQVFFPFLVFNRFLKLPTLVTVMGMHAGIGILMGLPVFALVMIGTEMIFVPDSFWHRLTTLSPRVQINPQTVGALERGDHYPSLDLALRICSVFDLPVEAVFSRSDFTPPSAEVYRNTRPMEGSDSSE